MGRLLSPSGRLILIKHVLSPIPLHALSAMSIPKQVLQQLERIFSNFLWRGDSLINRRIWRSWSRVSFPFDENGLGVRSLLHLHRAYSCKLWWRLHTSHGLWASYVNSISLPKSIAFRRIQDVDGFMLDNTRMLVCNGSLSFKFSDWSGSGALIDLFPSLAVFPDLPLCQVYVDRSWNPLLPPEVLSFVAPFLSSLSLTVARTN